jgi:hypothetical protein
MPFLSQAQQDPPPCILSHGIHGRGKTTLAFEGGKPFGIVLELKARNRIRKINPNADGYFPTSLEDLEKLLVFLGTEKFLNAGFDRIVLDSYTELTNALPNWLILKNSPGLKLDPGRLVEKQEYGPVKGWAMAIVKAIQLTNLPSIILCRSEEKDGYVVPMSTGSSAKHLSSMVNATFEAIYDNELGYIWTSEPHDLSYRCGLPSVPQKWNGTAMDLLTACASANEVSGPDTPQPPVPQDARAQGLAKPAETLGQVAENVAQATKESPAPVSQAAADFVDKMDPEIVNNEEAREIIDLCMTYKIPQDKLINYLLAKGGMNLKGWKDRPSFLCMTKKGHAGIFPILCDENRRRAFVAHLVNGSYDAPPSATAAPAPMAATA